MSESTRSLVRLVDELESEGAPAQRIKVAQCALNFRRSWVDLAEVLVHARDSRAFTDWGYTEFLSYCKNELDLKAPLVDKLTVSYRALNKYAPDKLASGGEDAGTPSYAAIDYFSRAIGEPRSNGEPARDAPDEAPEPAVMNQLRAAVFEEGQSLRKLRENFDPILRPKAPEELQLLALRRARLAAQRLLGHLEEIDGLSEHLRPTLEKALDDLEIELENLTNDLDKAEEAEAQAS